MKLSNLNGAIRKTSNVFVRVNTPIGPVTVAVQKASLMDGLKAASNGDNKIETAMSIDDEGVLTWETAGGLPTGEVVDDDAGAAHEGIASRGGIDSNAVHVPSTADPSVDDMDDLLG